MRREDLIVMWIKMLMAVAVVAVVMLGVVVAAGASEPCTEDGVPGIMHPIDGCFTIVEYNEMFSYENLSKVPWQGDPGRSVAEVAGLTVDPVPPAERPRHFMGVEYPSFRVFLDRLHIPV